MPGAQQSHLPELKYTRSAMEKCKQIANLQRYKLNIIQPCRLFTPIHYSQRGYPQHPNFARLSWWLRGSALPLEFKSQAQKHWTLRCRPCKQGSGRFLTGSTCSIMQLISWFSMIFNDFQCLYHLPYLVLWNSWHSIQGLEAESQAAFAHSWGRARMDGWEDFGWNCRKEQFLDKKLCGIWVRIGDPVSPKGFPPKIKRFDWSDA